jgi:selenocysteine lyase/cysteine desulfurase
MSTRRNFLRSLSAGAALPASWTAFAASLQAAPPSPAATDETYWAMVKRQFPLEPGLLYFNAANVCPASRPVLDRHSEFLRDFHSNPSFQNRDKYAPIQERLRGKLGAMLGVTSEEIAITRNTSEGTNVVVRGIDLKAGDEIVITTHNHPSNNDSWQVRAKREGLVVKSVPVPIPATRREELVASLEKAITPRTRVLAVTHATNTTGVLFPVREICELGRKRGIWVHVDGAQTFGALDVNLRAMGCDSYSGSAHKWMMGPLEAGVLYVRADRIAQLWPSIVTAGWSEKLVGARKFEIVGQRDDPRVVAFEAAVDFVNLIGMRNVEARMRTIATHLKERLREIRGVSLKTVMEAELSAGVVKFTVPGSLKETYDALWKRHRLALALTASGESSGIRFSPHIYNSREEVDQAAAAIRELVRA